MEVGPGRANELRSFDHFEALTFDCYGTLIDWESGITDALKPILEAHGVSAGRNDLLAMFARHEAAAEAGPYVSYREVLAKSVRGISDDLGLIPTASEINQFSESVTDWPAFSDSPKALAQLASRYRLGVLTNCDDDLFAESSKRLGVGFDWVITAQQVGAYKPSEAGFIAMLAEVALPVDRVLHVAQSLYHDHVPARRIGMTTVWIDRRHDQPGSGATPPAYAIPNARFESMADFADAAT